MRSLSSDKVLCTLYNKTFVYAIMLSPWNVFACRQVLIVLNNTTATSALRLHHFYCILLHKQENVSNDESRLCRTIPKVFYTPPSIGKNCVTMSRLKSYYETLSHRGAMLETYVYFPVELSSSTEFRDAHAYY